MPIPWDTIATILTILGSIGSLAYWLGRRFTEIEGRFRVIDEKFKQVDERFGIRFRELEKRIENLRISIMSATRSIQAFTFDFLSIKGLITRDERDFAIRQIDRIIEASFQITNPLKPEEVRFIKEVLKEVKEKDPKDVDMRKVEQALRIIEKWSNEECSVEAFKAWMYMYLIKVSLEKERGEL